MNSPILESRSSGRIGRYRVIRPIGFGGMAEALLCELPSEAGLHKRVVVKRLHPHLRSETEVVRMLLDEARITLPLQHSNIANAFELGRDGEDYYLVCEHVDGADLGAVLAHVARPLPPATALVVTIGVLEGLVYAHDARDPSGRPLHIVHRDVSPGNILLSRSGDVKLADFGVARARHRLRSTIDGVVRGTLVHMSPEQAAGDEVDGRSDLYSLGTVLWRMVAGREIPGITKGYGKPPLLELGLGHALDHVLAGALALRREDRFAHAGEMLGEARQVLAELAPEADGRSLVAGLLAEMPAPLVTVAPPPASRTAATVVLPGDRPAWFRRRTAGVILAAAAIGITIALARDSQPPSSRARPAAIPVPVTAIAPAGPPAATPALDARASRPEAGPAPRASRPRPAGTLDLSASPWAYVEVDGTRVGATPKRLPAAAGSHRVRFVNPELGRSKEVIVDVRPSAVVRVSVNLDTQ